MADGPPPIYVMASIVLLSIWCLGFLCTTFVILTDLLSEEPCPGRTGKTPLGGVVIALLWPFYVGYHSMVALIPHLKVAKVRIGEAWKRVKSNDWDI